MLLVAKISSTTYLIEFLQYHFKTRKFQSILKFTGGKWLEQSSCHLITYRYLLCVDQKDHEFQLFDLNDRNPLFKRIPLSTFGLNTELNSIVSIKLQTLPELSSLDKTITISESKKYQQSPLYFALELGGEQGVIIFKIVEVEGGGSSIQLVKIFPFASRATIIPLISSEQESNEFHLDQKDNFNFGMAVMFTKPQSIPYEDQADGKHQQKVFAIKLAIFHLNSWAEITSISSKSILLEFGSKTSIAPINSNGKLVKRLDDRWTIDRFEILPIRTLIYNTRTGRDQYRFTYKLLLTTIDGTIVVTNLMGKINWAREEALSEINNLIMLDLPLSQTDANLEEEYEFDKKTNNVVAMFVHRIKSQLIQLIGFCSHSQNWLLHSFNRLNLRKNFKDSHELLDDEQSSSSIVLDQEESTALDDGKFVEAIDEDDSEVLVRDYFGLHKIIISRTKTGKIFAMETFSGKIVWSRHEPNLSIESNRIQFPIWIQRTNAHYPHSAICTILNSNSSRTFLYSFNPVTGKVLDSRWLPFKIVQAMLLQTIQDSEFRRPLLLLDSNSDAWLYPDNNEIKLLFEKVSDTHFMMIINQSSAFLTGFNFKPIQSSNADDTNESKRFQLKATKIWSYQLPFENKLVSVKAVFKRPHENVHSQGRVLGDRNVLYKYLNPNLVAVLCEHLDLQEKCAYFSL
ncbi:hypothetical protein QR98_0082220 [Sarcoptes scabiei]|uniref:ER membrane protein complex subunit 1 n=1 Tax=Sarcoptes scabiei TaxID=52283 RepID=A0A132AFQ2_SARSC|nr:hypothetical protein QR98_0082220 [Sarcoptes scabiei]